MVVVSGEGGVGVGGDGWSRGSPADVHPDNPAELFLVLMGVMRGEIRKGGVCFLFIQKGRRSEGYLRDLRSGTGCCYL